MDGRDKPGHDEGGVSRDKPGHDEGGASRDKPGHDEGGLAGTSPVMTKGAGQGLVSTARGSAVSNSGPVSVTRTVSLSDAPPAEAYMWNTMPASTAQSASG